MIYSSAVRINHDNIVYNKAQFELYTGAQVAASLLELRLHLATWGGPAGVGFALGRPGAQGAGRINSISQQFMSRDFDKSVIPPVYVATGWSTLPTTPVNFFRRAELLGNPYNSTSSVQITWRFPRGLTILQSNSLVLWSVDVPAGTSTTFSLDVSMVINV